MRRTHRSGFSLVELAVVLTIVGLIALFVTPALGRYLNSYRVKDAARQLSSELRMARQKAVSNGTRNWYYAGTGASSGFYWTGIQSENPDGSWTAITWTVWNMPKNTIQVTPVFNGVNYMYYDPNGRPSGSGSVRVASTVASISDTAQVNVDLSGSVWQ